MAKRGLASHTARKGDPKAFVVGKGLSPKPVTRIGVVDMLEKGEASGIDRRGSPSGADPFCGVAAGGRTACVEGHYSKP